MRKRASFLVLPALLLLPVLRLLGGWAVVTLDEMPEYLVARQPTTLSFMVRQHGVTPLKGVHPTLEARAGSRSAEATVIPGKEDGRYVATFTPPGPGDWTLTINSGWGNSKLTLLPIKVIEPGSPVPVAMGAPELGRHLFVAKGCVGCHMRAEAELGEGGTIGPSLTGKRYAADYVKRFLANPAMADRPRSGTFVMPNLDLKQAEIAALVAFLNAERQASQ